jgi:hypothetical protein
VIFVAGAIIGPRLLEWIFGSVVDEDIERESNSKIVLLEKNSTRQESRPVAGREILEP